MRSLADWPEELFWTGTLFRVPDQERGGGPVDVMIADVGSYSESGFAIMYISGWNTGNIKVNLPYEARMEGKVFAVSKKWLQSNWEKWVYPGTAASSVSVRRKVPIPTTNEFCSLSIWDP